MYYWNKLTRSLSGAKLLWNNEDWDSAFLLELMSWKLKRLEKAIRYGHCVGQEKRADEIRTCILLIERIINHNYISEGYAKHLDDWWKSRTEISTKDGGVIIDFPDDDKMEKVRNRHQNHLMKLEQQDYDLLFRILHRKIQYWWD